MRWTGLLDLVYPRTCAGCGGPVDPESLHVCWDCLSRVTYVQPPYCSRCGDPVDGRVDDAFVCYHCAESEPFFERARSAARYRGVLQDLLREFKYREGLWLRHELARLLEACVTAHYEPDGIDAVAFVPLYPARRRERGFNQAELLAGSLARRLRKPLLGRCLVRVRPTGSQTNLTAPQRASNVRGAFETRRRRRLEGRNVLLVDDVMTTGATVNECARALKEGGAARVYVVTVARG
ncbi:MAG: ComF family protein [Verrucomicrobiota bacterium]